MLQVDPIQSYLNFKIGLPLVLKAGSSGICKTFHRQFDEDVTITTTARLR
jgi:hypothetical protein